MVPLPSALQVRYVGVSNETSYGVMRFVQVRGVACEACCPHMEGTLQGLST